MAGEIGRTEVSNTEPTDEMDTVGLPDEVDQELIAMVSSAAALGSFATVAEIIYQHYPERNLLNLPNFGAKRPSRVPEDTVFDD